MMHWILTSCLLIVAVLLIRAVGRDRLSARLRYALWGLVLLRLLIPVSIGESALSVENWLPEETTQTEQTMPVTIVPSETIQTNGTTQTMQPTVQAQPRISAADVVEAVWIGGCIIVGGIFLMSNLRFALLLRRSRRCVAVQRISIYETAAIETPCLFGFPVPAVYMTPAVMADKQAQQHVLAHELTHFRHGDHLWSLLRCVCVTLHWYNPLVWLAAILSQKDGELACDEGALRRLGDEARRDYARTLLDLTCVGYRGILTAATSMTGSESDLKTRVMRIVKNPKMKVTALIAVLVIAALIAVMLFTGAASTAPAIEGVWRMDMSILGEDITAESSAYMEYEFSGGRGLRTDYVNGEIRSAEHFSYSLGEQTVSMLFESASEPMNYNWSISGDTLTLSAKRGELVLTRAERARTDFLPEGSWELMDVCMNRPEGSMLAEINTTQKAQLMQLLYCGEVTETRTAQEPVDSAYYELYLNDGAEWLTLRIANGLAYTDGEETGCVLSNMDGIYELLSSLSWGVGQFNETMETSGFAPSDMAGITSARMILYGQAYYADPGQLAFLEELLTTAVDMGYPTACPFDGILEVTLSNGRVLAVVPALDSCAAFMIGDVCYEYGNQFAYDDEGSYDNSALLAIFGLNADIIMELWETQFAFTEGEVIGTTADIGDVVRVANDVMEPAYLTDESRETMINLFAMGVGDVIGEEEVRFDTTYYIIYSSGLDSKEECVTLSDNGSLYIDGLRYELNHSDAILELLEGAYRMRITLKGYDVDELNGSVGEFLYPELCGAPVGEITWYSSEENVCTVVGDAYGATITVTGVGSAQVTAQCRDKNGTVTSDTITILGRETW